MSITPLIQMFMLTAAALILLFCRVKANDVASSRKNSSSVMIHGPGPVSRYDPVAFP